jgi:3-phosphoshikimate 1-carboxyvinyltransferase
MHGPSLVVRPAARPLHGSVPAPIDKSLAHRALLLAGLATGDSELGLPAPLGDDNLSTAAALRAMGVVLDLGPRLARVKGVGLWGLRAPAAPLDCGNSGTTMRLLAGVLACQRFASRLVGDASLSRRPMQRVATPLRRRGGRIEGQLDPRRPGELTAPLDLGPLPEPHLPSELEYSSPIASAQVKSAVLLSGLYADGPTYVSEPVVSRDHTERMLRALGVPIEAVGPHVALDPSAWSGELPAFRFQVPGDPSGAAFALVAGAIVPGSHVEVRGVGLNPTRAGAFEVLRDAGARVAVRPDRDELGEPTGTVAVAAGALAPVRLGGETLVRAIDEVPILAALAARASGVSAFVDAAELRAKESDRIRAVVQLLRAFGVEAHEQADGFELEGQPDRPLRAAEVDSGGDHRIAMTAAVLGLVADGETVVRGAGPIATSFPRFVGTLRALGADIEVRAE